MVNKVDCYDRGFGFARVRAQVHHSPQTTGRRMGCDLPTNRSTLFPFRSCRAGSPARDFDHRMGSDLAGHYIDHLGATRFSCARWAGRSLPFRCTRRHIPRRIGCYPRPSADVVQHKTTFNEKRCRNTAPFDSSYTSQQLRELGRVLLLVQVYTNPYCVATFIFCRMLNQSYPITTATSISDPSTGWIKI